MKKLFITVLALCFLVPCVVLAETTKPLKCEVPAGAYGAIIIPDGSAMVPFIIAEDVTITVLEVFTDELKNEDGTKEEYTLYRFSAAYDKPVLVCRSHGSHTYEEYSQGMPEKFMNYFWLDSAVVKECK